ncbi:hypothetical protein BDR04DRAFT_1095479 [Suillus decipiens]|nr:hypothetical protein BDR04DRAFT_1095462 [Suillus decipiens]KAG2073028.1 hypothetical protein BDR04DRAFT_1095479 [Suillus decipiens]
MYSRPERMLFFTTTLWEWRAGEKGLTSTQGSTFNVQRSMFNVQCSMFNVQRSTFRAAVFE